MRPHNSHDGPARRQCRPGLEGLENRDLLSSNPLGPALPGKHLPAVDVQQFVPILYPPGTPQPTPAEVARESFVNKAVGFYTLGPGRFNTQKLTIHGYGKPSSSNLVLGNHFQYVLFEPADPTQPVTGVISLLGKNYLQNGTQIVLDLMGPVGSEVNGLPTHLFWAHDAASATPSAGAGIALPGYSNFPTNYFNAQGLPANPPPGPNGPPPSSVNNWNLGAGDVTFRYIPNPRHAPGTLGSGMVIVEIRGLLNYSAVQSVFNKNTQ